jgi:hypothetical protein
MVRPGGTWIAILALMVASPALQADQAGDSPAVSVFGGGANPEVSGPGGTADIGTIQRTPNHLDCSTRKRGEFAFAPIPVVNPTLGDGLAAVVLYMVNLGPCTATPAPSTFGAMGMKTNNGSWAVGTGANLILLADRLRITVGAGGGTFNYNYYGIGNSAGSNGVYLKISQESTAFLIEPKVRLIRKWYVGPRYHIIRNTIRPDVEATANQPALPESDLNVRTAALGLRVQNDMRDSQFYPTKGALLDQKLDFFNAAFGGRRTYQSELLSYSKYIGFGQKNVLAMRGSVCAAWGPVPFYDLCALGMSQDLRGYEIGRYRDKRFLAAQVEFRRELFWRFGAVAFMGAGEVGPTFGDFNTANLLPGGGVGLRFLLTKQNHVNLRVDYALGRDSHALYLGVMEAF